MNDAPRKGRMIYAPREFIGELNTFMNERKIKKRSEAMIHMTNYYAVGRELENLTKFRLGAPRVRQYDVKKK